MVPRTLYTLQPLWPSTAFRTPASLELRDIPKSHLLRLSFPPSNHVVGCVILGPGSDASPIPILTNCRLHAPYRACASFSREGDDEQQPATTTEKLAVSVQLLPSFDNSPHFHVAYLFVKIVPSMSPTQGKYIVHLKTYTSRDYQYLTIIQVKCDRVTPCSHCVKAGVSCSYAAGPKPRERRQRVMISNT